VGAASGCDQATTPLSLFAIPTIWSYTAWATNISSGRYMNLTRWIGPKRNGRDTVGDDTNSIAVKYITAEYHEGQNAYANGMGMTTNPYLSSSGDKLGKLWYWMAGWQDAMQLHTAALHNDLEAIKGMIAMAVADQPVPDKEGMH